MYCTKCGAIIEDDAVFCSKCGSAISSENEQRKSNYVGEVKKCPGCGAILAPISCYCSECGLEFSGTKNAKPVEDFFNQYTHAASDSEKIELIKTFPIPNNKEAIIEFAWMACRHINAQNNSEYDNPLKYEYLSAWLSQLDTTCKKASKLFKDSEDYVQIEKMYNNKLKEYKKAIKKKHVTSFTSKHKRIVVFTVIVVIIALITAFIFISGAASKISSKISDTISDNSFDYNVKTIENLIKKKDYEEALSQINLLNTEGMENRETIKQNLVDKIARMREQDEIDNDFDYQVGVIESYIVKQEYDRALSQAYLLETDGSNAKKKTRQSLIDKIKDLQYRNELIQIPTTDFNNKTYQEVINIFKNAGFININIEKVKKGWFDKENNVKEVSIDGITEFSETTKYKRDSKIIIKYYSKEE